MNALEAAPDGRSIRRERNRDAALDSLLVLFEAGGAVPTVEEVAEHAGLSARSIYRYFTDRETFMRAGFARLVERAGPLLVFDSLGLGSFADRVERFVDHRLALYDEFGSVALTAARGAATDPFIAEQFQLGYVLLRQQFVDHFDPELGRLTPIERTRATTLATLAFQFESFEFLHASLSGQRGAMRELLVDQLSLNLGRFRTHAVD